MYRDSYHLSGSNVTVRIYQPTHADTSFQRMRASNSAIGTYLVFQPVRFTVPLLSPVERWALTPPFHLFRIYSLQFTVYSSQRRQYHYCLLLTAYYLLLTENGSLFSVALAVKLSSPTTCLPVRKYGTLCCPDFPSRPQRTSGSER